MNDKLNAEKQRLYEANTGQKNWRHFGPYLSERQWGTVREDYSAGGYAWEYTNFDIARSYSYRWGEEGLAGFCDTEQLLCLSVALWNGQDSILKDQLFGLSGPQGNHGEDVKELYYYLDNTPTHSYQKLLYKYPQVAFPYEWLRGENARRTRQDPEFELLDTGLFDEGRYFDVLVEYAKASPDDLLLQVTVHNRGPAAVPLHVLPQLWFRNTWAWGYDDYRPALRTPHPGVVQLTHRELGDYQLYCDQTPELLFCDNDTNSERLYGQPRAEGQYYKDGLNDYLVRGRPEAVNPQQHGTKAAAHYPLLVAPGQAQTVRVRLRKALTAAPFADFDQLLTQRRQEADAFYDCLQADLPGADARHVQRQALAGMLWSKQFYYYDLSQWLDGDPHQEPPPTERRQGRNRDWRHLYNADIISMPDKWEYPWYAAWDLAFHCVPLAMVDSEFAKSQLRLLTRDWYMHPNGQLPAYEWNLSDVNPPVHAWATWRVYQLDQQQRGGRGDLGFLEAMFHKLSLNFAWWVNRKDHNGCNIFQGGFLGLDNIGVFDRSAPLPTGGFIEQSDGTSWMAMYALNLMRIALELARHNPVYQEIASKFFEHFLYIVEAMTKGGNGAFNLWDETDSFYYDVLHTPDGRRTKLKVRFIVGLVPLFAVEVLDQELLDAVPEFTRRLHWLLRHRPQLAALVSHWQEPGKGERHCLSLLRRYRLQCLLTRLLDEAEFLSAYGIRGLSRYHHAQPYHFHTAHAQFTVAYLPGESDSSMFGGNSNWRGPIWLPINYLIIESLQHFHAYYDDTFRIEYPTGSGQLYNLQEVAAALAARLGKLFLRGDDGRRPCFGPSATLQHDLHFCDYLLFHEYFHGDDGRGLGASHQTGWTGLIAKLLPQQTPAAHAQVPAGQARHA